MKPETPDVFNNTANNRTDSENTPNPRQAILEAIDRHDDPDERNGAPIGDVIEGALVEVADHAALAQLTLALHDLALNGLIYRPSEMTVARCHVEADVQAGSFNGDGRPPREMRGRLAGSTVRDEVDR